MSTVQIFKLIEHAFGAMPEDPDQLVLELGFVGPSEPAVAEKAYVYFLLAGRAHVEMLRDLCDEFLLTSKQDAVD